jgi:four helix bundle protein
MKNFKQLRVWQKGLEIALASYELVQAFPKEERYGLSSQITRAAVSIPSNIAEGSSRSSDLDHIRFMEIALGSLFELETQVLISKSLKFGDLEKSNHVLQEIQDAQKMLIGFISKLRQDTKPS